MFAKLYEGKEGWDRYMTELNFFAEKFQKENPEASVKRAPAYTAFFPEVKPENLFSESQKTHLAQFGVDKPFDPLAIDSFKIEKLSDCTPYHVLTASEMTRFAHELHKQANPKHEIPAYVTADVDLARKNCAKFASYNPATAETPFIVIATLEREQYLKACKIPDENELAQTKDPMALRESQKPNLHLVKSSSGLKI